MMARSLKKKRSRRRSLWKLPIMLFLVIVLAFSGWQIWQHFAHERQVAAQFDELAQQINQPGNEEPEWTVHDQYRELFEQNSDMIGWIAIDGTSINYPVMHTPERPNFYLNHNFEGRWCEFGVPYIFEYSSFDPHSDNITIFGHNMRNGSMFAALVGYEDEDFFREHPVIRFDTLAGFGEYEIIAAFFARPTVFEFHSFVDAVDRDEFEEFVRRIEEYSLYDTGITAEYGDRLLTLSTCVRGRSAYRFAVVARKIQNV